MIDLVKRAYQISALPSSRHRDDQHKVAFGISSYAQNTKKSCQMSEDNRFKPGNTFGHRGRPLGLRNKLQHKFLQALQEDFETEGEKVIRIARIEKPIEYLKLIAGLLPKELLITDNVLGDMSDEQLLETIAAVRKAKEKLATAPAPVESETTKH